MAVSDGFLAYILDQFAPWGGVTARKMFGGAGLYRAGKMFGLVADDVAYLKADDASLGDFQEAGSAQFNPFPDRPARMPYYEVPPAVLEDPNELIRWAENSWKVQAGPGRNPAKGRKAKDRKAHL